MKIHARKPLVCVALLALVLAACNSANAQGTGGEVEFVIDRPNSRMEMVVTTSRILKLEKQVPRALVNNTDIIEAYPLSPTQVQLSAKKTGLTTVNLWDEDGQLYTVDVVVLGDARELEMILRTQFPEASLRVHPLSRSVVLSGRVDRPEIVSRIVRIAQDYSQNVINNITVGGVQQILLNVKVMEVSRTKLRALGVDWMNIGNTDTFTSSVSGLLQGVSQQTNGATTPLVSGTETMTAALISQGNSFFAVLEALADNQLAKILSEPKLMTVSGRPASFNAGGEFPIVVPQSLGTVGIEYKQFGTRVDFVPIVLGHGSIRLEVRPQVSELDAVNAVTINSTRVPGLRTRWVDTAVEMKAGQTLALAGLIQTRVEASRRQVPLLGDLPWAGAMFRRVQEEMNEVELVVLVTPELVDAMDPHEVPRCGPGERTASPDDIELYARGYLEVPKCCTDGSCSACQAGNVPVDGAYYPSESSIPAGITAPQYHGEPTSADGYQPVETQGPALSPSADRRMRPGVNTRSAQNVYRGQNYRSARRPSPQPGPRPTAQQNRQYQYNPPRTSSAGQSQDPGLFGRVGYDVVN
ncbi:MAG: pilus assembly protein N-terminal domain-containing protein [Planctomycetales bacterium]|nr:pilus assembly protein N-terminal domain-containing protein [Planctomycetales bacterium]